MFEQEVPGTEPLEPGEYQPLPDQSGRPSPDADPQPTPARPAPETARPDTPPTETEEDLRPLEHPELAPGPGEMGGETPTLDSAARRGV